MTSSSVRALIVDDDLIAQKMVQVVFERKGFVCDFAADGVDALDALSQYRYDVVVTDLVMPRMNGGELVMSLCARLRRPIIVVHTVIQEPEVFHGLRREGVDDIFHKPADYEEMADKIQRRVDAQRARQTRMGRRRRGRVSGADKSHDVIRSLMIGDRWIQSRAHRMEVFRFGIVILGCILFGLGLGNSLTPEMANLCKMFGLCGLAFYFCLELVAHYRDQTRVSLLRCSAERRLARERAVNADDLIGSIPE